MTSRARGSDPHQRGTSEERRAVDDLFVATYQELRRLANRIARHERTATLTPTALVNEAWVKLANAPGFASSSPLHFKRIACRAMRQVLVEAARRRQARKRGGGKAGMTFISFDDGIDALPLAPDLLALDAALEDLARLHPRQAAMVEARFFGGLDVAETAALLGVSEATILRDWRAAKAWLASEMRRGR